jgi:hypothetical protein
MLTTTLTRMNVNVSVVVSVVDHPDRDATIAPLPV